MVKKIIILYYCIGYIYCCWHLVKKIILFFSGNFLGPIIFNVKTIKSKLPDSSLIIFDSYTIKNQIVGKFDTWCHDNKIIFSNFIFDDNKVPYNLLISTNYKSIIGGDLPNHLINIYGMTEEEVSS